MRQGLLFSIILLGTVCGTVWALGGDMGAGTEPSTDGSEIYPYLIEDVNDFDEFAGNSAYWASGVHTKLMTDMDLAGRTYTTAVIAPDPQQNVYFDGISFSGVFDGTDHTITNLIIDTSGMNQECLGLFGWVGVEGEINALHLENTEVCGDYYVGSLAGGSDGIITNCTATGTVTGYNYIGGLVGVLAYNISMDIYNCEVNNCHTAVIVAGTDIVGGLIGSGTSFSFVTNSSAIGSVTGRGGVGGLLGSSYSTITQCYALGNVSGTAGNVGGLVGSNSYHHIENCYAKGNVEGDSCVGGLVGGNRSLSQWSGGEIVGCFSVGSVTGRLDVGGLAGYNDDYSIITNCYSTGSVTGSLYHIGGLVGLCEADGAIDTCYSTGQVTGMQYPIGGLVGDVQGIGTESVTKCYWDIQTSGTSDGFGDSLNPPGAEGKTTSEMMTQSTFTGWDFVNDWVMLREGEDYPRLAWQEIFTGDIAGLYGVDLIDVAYLSQYWGLDDCNGADDCGRTDIDGSGDVGITDLVSVVEDWLLGIN